MTGGAASPLPLHPHNLCCESCKRLNVRGVEAVEEATVELRGFVRHERDVLDPQGPGDLAEGLVSIAAALVCLVRGDGGADSIRYLLRRLSQRQIEALPIVVAAMVDPSTKIKDAFGWITWDENGRLLERKPRLDGTVRSTGENYLEDKAAPSGVKKSLETATRVEARGMYLRGDTCERIALALRVDVATVHRWVKDGAA